MVTEAVVEGLPGLHGVDHGALVAVAAKRLMGVGGGLVGSAGGAQR